MTSNDGVGGGPECPEALQLDIPRPEGLVATLSEAFSNAPMSVAADRGSPLGGLLAGLDGRCGARALS